jgi:cysteine sulfinate desulfinase/cysteine desulfurase-like protein
MRRIYFDNAATTPLAPEVFEAMLPYLKEHYGNPSAIHAYGRKDPRGRGTEPAEDRRAAELRTGRDRLHQLRHGVGQHGPL